MARLRVPKIGARGGFLLLAGAGVVVAVPLLLRNTGNPFDAGVSEVQTSASGAGKSRAQILQDLRQRKAALETKRDQQAAAIEAEYDQRAARETWEGIDARVRQECEGTGFCLFNPWCGCDDQVLADVIAENKAWRVEQMNARVRPLDQQIASIAAEIESLMLTA